MGWHHKGKVHIYLLVLDYVYVSVLELLREGPLPSK